MNGARRRTGRSRDLALFPTDGTNSVARAVASATLTARVPEVELTESFLAKIGGWEAVKIARHLLAEGKVLSSNYTPPILKGVVQEGTTTYRSGLVLKSGIDLENLCSCRASRDWGTICAHSVAVGLHHLKPLEAGGPA